MRPLIQLCLTGAAFSAAPLAASPLLVAQGPALAPISQAELTARLSKSLDSLSNRDQFSGVVLISKGGAPVFQHAYGMADREADRANDVETAFNLGSINKVFTATAIRQLVAAGRLDLDSTVAKYWPSYPNAEVAKRITIRQLLQHRSGIGGDIFDPPPGGKRSEIRHNRDFLQLFADRPLEFEPGSRSEYSNAGYVVLGLLVERLSGEDYYAYIRQHIYEPAGMTRTGHFPVDSVPPNTAIGYTRAEADSASNAPLHRNTDLLPGRGSAAGGGYSTVGDLARFVQALRQGRITAGPPAGIGAAGGTQGVNSVVEGDLPGGYDLVVLSNLDPPAAMRVSRMVREWLGARD
jgi:D-alanyl-D-alanine carboxypeptidase